MLLWDIRLRHGTRNNQHQIIKAICSKLQNHYEKRRTTENKSHHCIKLIRGQEALEALYSPRDRIMTIKDSVWKAIGTLRNRDVATGRRLLLRHFITTSCQKESRYLIPRKLWRRQPKHALQLWASGPRWRLSMMVFGSIRPFKISQSEKTIATTNLRVPETSASLICNLLSAQI